MPEELMCPGDSDYCPHRGCTTCQGTFFYFPDPHGGLGWIDDNDTVAWAAYIERWKLREAQNRGERNG